MHTKEVIEIGGNMKMGISTVQFPLPSKFTQMLYFSLFIKFSRNKGMRVPYPQAVIYTIFFILEANLIYS